MDDWHFLYDFDKRDVNESAAAAAAGAGKRYPGHCDDHAIHIQDFFSYRTIFNPNDPTDPGGNGLQTINWLIYNTSDWRHKTSVCLGHQCLFVVPVWQPQVQNFLKGN